MECGVVLAATGAAPQSHEVLLRSDPQVVRSRWTSVVARSLNVLLRTSMLERTQDLESYGALLNARPEFDLEFRYVAIPLDFEIPDSDQMFDAPTMRALVDLGRRMGGGSSRGRREAQHEPTCDGEEHVYLARQTSSRRLRPGLGRVQFEGGAFRFRTRDRRGRAFHGTNSANRLYRRLERFGFAHRSRSDRARDRVSGFLEADGASPAPTGGFGLALGDLDVWVTDYRRLKSRPHSMIEFILGCLLPA
jgi:hypothetical protein